MKLETTKQKFALLFSLLIIASLFWMYLFTGKNEPSPYQSQQIQSVNQSFYFEGKTTEKNVISMSQYSNTVLVINFWATWCPPCVAEAPHLVELQEKYNNKNFQIIGISLDKDTNKVMPFINEYKINYPILLGSTFSETGFGDVSSIPTTFIFDKKHNLIKKIKGYRSFEEFEKIISPLL